MSPQTQISPIQVYHCFNCGISLLQCLALRPTILPPRRTVRAIVACSSALAIYTKSLSTASIFLELFERLSDRFLGNDEGVEAPRHPDLALRSVLGEIIASAPADMPKSVPRLAPSLLLLMEMPATGSYAPYQISREKAHHKRKHSSRRTLVMSSWCVIIPPLYRSLCLTSPLSSPAIAPGISGPRKHRFSCI